MLQEKDNVLDTNTVRVHSPCFFGTTVVLIDRSTDACRRERYTDVLPVTTTSNLSGIKLNLSYSSSTNTSTNTGCLTYPYV